MIASNLSVNAAGHLCFAGQDTTELSAQYGTPLYLMDEERIRQNCRTYLKVFRECFAPGSLPLYASKANAFRQLFRIVQEEGLGADVVSAGEIHTAASAGFDMSRTYFHSNNKTDADIAFAMDKGVGCFVVDGEEELIAIESEAARRGIRQPVLLRLTPGIDPHTYAQVATGQVDSKFGCAIETGQADAFVRIALAQPHLEVRGFHCHVGSQVFGEDVFLRTARVMLDYIRKVRDELGWTAGVLDLGGGYGVRYVESDPPLDLEQKLRELAEEIHRLCRELELPEPAILMEPGRSIVADAGLTLYTVGATKRIPGYKNYVSVDGGMGDNPRFALYGARYTCLAAGNMTAERPLIASLVGRFCESGDVLQEDVPFPADIGRGDLVAVCTTGAYNYSMASNYNRVPRPPVVMLKDGGSYVAVRRETPEDVSALDL